MALSQLQHYASLSAESYPHSYSQSHSHHSLSCRSEAALAQLQHYASLYAAGQLDAEVSSTAAADLACFAAINEAEFGSMEALDKQVGALLGGMVQTVRFAVYVCAEAAMPLCHGSLAP